MLFIKYLILSNIFFAKIIIFLKNKEKIKYKKLEIIKEEKIYEIKKIILIYLHKSGFLIQISNGCIPYVIITELA